ncbi:MAG: hypothetical protein WC860_03445 [Candidatus Margulisiibacteriota bacterium]|jgi:hypothetical protein
MLSIFDPLLLTNLLLCVIILIFGFWGFKKSKDTLPLYVGLAFGLFGISHLMTMLGLKNVMESMLIFIRTFAYLLVIFALYKLISKKK